MQRVRVIKMIDSCDTPPAEIAALIGHVRTLQAPLFILQTRLNSAQKAGFNYLKTCLRIFKT